MVKLGWAKSLKYVLVRSPGGESLQNNSYLVEPQDACKQLGTYMMPQLSQPRVRVQRDSSNIIAGQPLHYQKCSPTPIIAPGRRWCLFAPLCATTTHHATGQELAPMASRLDWTTKTAASLLHSAVCPGSVVLAAFTVDAF